MNLATVKGLINGATKSLKSAIETLEPDATSSDIGKFVKVKTVADGKVTEYEFDTPSIDPEDVAEAVDDWLDEHPEATTTVQDGSITEEKLASDVTEILASKPEVKTSSASGVDLDVADANGYVVLRLKNGEIKTKNFDSGVDCTEFINPYHDVLFADDTKVKTTTHDHCGNQTVLNKLLAKNLGAVALSNYYPSVPWYPLSEHNMSAGSGVVEIPNAEHHSFTDNSSFHVNAVGSTFESGKPSGQTPIGVNDTWKNGIIKMNLADSDMHGRVSLDFGAEHRNRGTALNTVPGNQAHIVFAFFFVSHSSIL